MNYADYQRENGEPFTTISKTQRHSNHRENVARVKSSWSSILGLVKIVDICSQKNLELPSLNKTVNTLKGFIYTYIYQANTNKFPILQNNFSVISISYQMFLYLLGSLLTTQL